MLIINSQVEDSLIIITFLLQVLDWLANHGEVFLQKNTGIGRNLHKARVYQKSHEHFENVAQVSTRYYFP